MNDLAAASKALGELSASTGVTTAEAAQAISEAVSKITFDPFKEAALIRANPSLSAFQKWRLTRRIMKLAPRPAGTRRT